ncbi:hypothetical protein [Lachnospira multipara]|uniref:hypothetical protein n=1 Tax=Lachnospira multipara TaxID=28051 RepID=UPI000483E757|nr:hypothetical protein [Lachnospira multipara]
MKKKILVTLLTIIVTVPMFMTGIITAQAAVDTSLFPDHPVYENEPEGAALIEKLGYPIANIDPNGQIMAIIDSDGTRYDLPAADPYDRKDKQRIINNTIRINLENGVFISGVSSLISDEEQYKNIAIYEANHAANQATEEPVTEEPVTEEPAAAEEAQPSNESDTIVVETPEPEIVSEEPTTALESVSNSIDLKSLSADDTKADAKTEDTKKHKHSSNPIIATFQKIGGGFLYIVDSVTDKIIGILSWF